jgi:hypothetical protein
VGADPAGSSDNLKPRIANSLSSGLLKGGEVSPNAITGLFDIAAGYGLCVDNTLDPANATYEIISWAGMTGIASPYLATDDFTYIAIDSTGSVVMQPEYFDLEDMPDLIIIGWIDHTDRLSIQFYLTEPYLASNVGVQFHTFLEALGSFNISGNEYSPNGDNLKLDKSAGSTFDNGTNYINSIKSPNILNNPGETGISFRYYYRTAPGEWFNNGPTVDTIDPENYDVGVGLTGVPSGKFTIQTITYYSPNNYTDIQYGQMVYDSLFNAGAALNIPIESDPYNAYDTFRAWLIVQQGCTGLSNIDQCVMVNAGRYGLISGRYGVGAGEANTASNVGLAGIGLFNVKSGIDLQFKNIDAGSNKIEISNDIPNKTVEVDVLPGNIDHGTLGNVIGGASGYHYHLDTTEYNWIHANPTGVLGCTGVQGHTGIQGDTGVQGVTGVGLIRAQILTLGLGA